MRTNIKKYFKFTSETHKNFKLNAYKYEDKYILTNTYSLLVLNNAEDLTINSEDKTLINFIKDFKDYEDIGKRLEDKIDFSKLNDYERYVEEIIKDKESSYGIDMEMFRTMYKIIKPTKIRILQKWGFNSWKYVYELLNEKNGEYGYLLPTKNYY